MPLSATSEYGIRCVVQLAQLEPGQHIAASEIALKEGLSVQYVSKLLHLLKKQGMIETVRGQFGGFRLSKPATEITLLEVLNILDPETDYKSICRQYSGNEEECVHTSSCNVRPVWNYVFGFLESIMEKLTLSDLSHSEYASFERVTQVAKDQSQILNMRLKLKKEQYRSLDT